MKIVFNYNKRVKDVKRILKENKTDSLLINKKERVYYLSGYRGDDAFLLVANKDIFLFTDLRYQEELRNTKYNFKTIISNNKIKEMGLLISKLNIKSLGIEENHISHNLFLNLKKNIKRLKIIPSGNILNGLMMIKDKSEIKAIKKAIAVTAKTLQFFKRIKKVGRSEEEIANELDSYILRCGAERGDFKTMVISDKRTALPHAQSSKIKIKNGTNLLIDLGTKSYGYNSDLTRVCALSKMKKRFKEIFEIVKAAQEKAIKAIKPGIKISQIDYIIRNYFKKFNLDNFFVHSSGHGVGLLVHEGPVINRHNHSFLKSGMVFTVEPGIYLPGEFGIRLEDIVLVTKKNCEVLSNDIPSTI